MLVWTCGLSSGSLQSPEKHFCCLQTGWRPELCVPALISSSADTSHSTPPVSQRAGTSPFPPQSKLHDHSLGASDSHTQSSSLLSGSLTHPPGVHSASVILQPGRLRTTFWHQNFCRPLHSVTFSIRKMRQIHEFCYVHELELLSRTPWLPSVFGW